MYSIEYRYLRPKKAAWLRRMYDTPFERRQELQVWRGRDAAILPLRELPEDGLLFGRGGVVDREGTYVPLSGIPGRVEGRYPFERPAHRDETVVYCGYLVNHWGHFLVEAVTRLWYALEHGQEADKFVFFLDEGQPRQIRGNYREFFQLLGLWDKLEFISAPTVYKEVIVPETAFRCMEFYSPKFLELFDAAAGAVRPDPAWAPAEKIFFTRSSFAKGNHFDFGLECLDNFFARNGYTVVSPETISLSQLIFLIRGAREVATISGSVHHNMLFARDGQKLTIVERFVINDDHQVCINRMRGLEVTPIDANFHLYPVDLVGPLMVGWNHLLERWAAHRQLLPPEEPYAGKAYRDRCFRSYMASYQDNYRYRWHMERWYPEICDSLYEAYQDNYPYFKEYLDGKRPFLGQHYFQPHYWKQFLKRILGKD